jgi:general secretion pathway protein D
MFTLKSNLSITDTVTVMPASAFKRNTRIWLLAPLLGALAFPAFGQTWKINLRDADITAFIGEVADITGKNFAIDPRVKGNITVISNKELSKDQVYELFLGVLNVNGVVAVPSGNTIKLVPDVNAKQSGVPFDLRNRAHGEQVVTRVLWLENTNANDLIPAIRPLMPQFAHLATVAGTNVLIVSDRAENIDQLENLVRTLDGGATDRLEIISLKNTNADEILTLVDAMSATSATRDVRGSRLRIVADTRSNRLLVKGDVRSRKRIRDLVNQLDVTPSDRLGGLRVFRLKNASAKSMATMLTGLMNNTSLTSPATASTLSSTISSSTGSGSSSTASGNSTPPVATPSSSGSTGSSSGSNSANSGISIIADESQNAVVVKADPSLMREIETAINQLDSRRPQVLIQAAIVEVSGDNIDQLGVQWALGNASSGVGAVNFTNSGVSLTTLYSALASKTPSLASGLAGALIGLGTSKTDSSGNTSFYGAILQALRTTSNANLLSVPSIMTLDNEEASIVVGQNVPFITGSTTSSSSGTSSPFTTIERKDVGINLKVIPHVGEGGTVRLEVAQEVSAVIPAVSGINSADLITNKRYIKTTILADDQQTIALGGLIQDDSKQSLSQVPGLGGLPLIGGLFRSKGNEHTKRNLLVFLQPTILRDNNGATALSQQRYNQIRTLQLELDQNGEFTRLPARVAQVYDTSASEVSPALKAKQ